MTHWIATHPWTAIAATCALALIVGAVGYYVGFFAGRLTAHWQLWSLTLLLLAAPAVGNDPPPEPVFERVDLLEVNHFYDEQGRLVFDQVIFYDYCPRAERFQVRAWRLIKCKAQLPVRDWEHCCWTATWLDGEVMRKVRALDYRESWSQYDPELVERQALPKERRRELLPLPRPLLP